MRILLILLLLIGTGWTQEMREVETPGGVLLTPVGNLTVPPGSQWRLRTRDRIQIYVGYKDGDVAVLYQLAILPQGIPVERDQEKAMKGFTEGYARSFSRPLGGLEGPVQTRLSARGCTFDFQPKQAKHLYGELIAGKDRALIFGVQGAGPEQLAGLVKSFQPDPTRFLPPVSRDSLRERLISGYSWGCSFVNVILAGLAGLIGLALGIPFWRSVRNLLGILLGLEFLAALAFIANHESDPYHLGRYLGYLSASLGIVGGLPLLIAHWLASRAARPPGA